MRDKRAYLLHALAAIQSYWPAHEEGPQAVRELARFREEFGLTGARIGLAGGVLPREATGAA